MGQSSTLNRQHVSPAEDTLRFARPLFFFERSWTSTHGPKGCHTRDTAPLGPRSESREARTAPTNKTLGSAVAVSALLPPQAAGDRRPRIPAILGWRPVSQEIRVDPRPRGVSEAADFEAETAAGNVDDHRVFLTLTARLWFGLGRATNNWNIPTDRRRVSHA